MTLQYDVLDKTAVSPKRLGNIGHREGQIGEAGREAFGEAGVFDRSQDGQKQQISQWDSHNRTGCSSLNMLYDIRRGCLKERSVSWDCFYNFHIGGDWAKPAGFILL